MKRRQAGGRKNTKQSADKLTDYRLNPTRRIIAARVARANPATDTTDSVRDPVGEPPVTPCPPEETGIVTVVDGQTDSPVVVIQLDGSHPTTSCLRISKLNPPTPRAYGAFCKLRRKNKVI